MAAYLSCVVVNTLEDHNVWTSRVVAPARRVYTWTRRKRQSSISEISSVIVRLSPRLLSAVNVAITVRECDVQMWGAISGKYQVVRMSRRPSEPGNIALRTGWVSTTEIDQWTTTRYYLVFGFNSVIQSWLWTTPLF